MALFKVLITISMLHIVYCLPEQGIWKVKISHEKNIFAFPKTMFNGTTVYLKVTCKSDDPNLSIRVSWLLRYSPCADEYIHVTDLVAADYLSHPDDPKNVEYKSAEFKSNRNDHKTYPCNGLIPISLDASYEANLLHKTKVPPPKNTTSTTTKTKKGKERVRRAARGLEPPKPALVTERPKGSSDDLHVYKLVKTWRDGAYLFVVNIHVPSSEPSAAKQKPQFEGEVTVWMRANYGYLSALEWPFLIFYGVMCLVYLAYGVAWILLSACHWRDLLRVQFWIGAVIVLGMLEKAVFYAEYQSINSSGHSVRGAVIFAEFVSCIKRTLARLLVMVVSIGYGIVKPRLGPALVKVVVIGVIYFIFALIEGCIRVLRPRYDMPRIILVVQVPLALVDAIILWWTFTYLVQTIQQMRLRRNLVKFNLYKHFSNILILVVGASVVFMGWSVFYHKWFACKKHWREIWVDDAFWHILFSVILLVIIWLWRPSKNNQRYAYSPVLDADDDADEDVLMDNFTTGEMTKKSSAAENGTSKREPKGEDDLRWVEEHIPSSSAAEHVFPLGDSDEEIATTKFHLNKME